MILLPQKICFQKISSSVVTYSPPKPKSSPYISALTDLKEPPQGVAREIKDLIYLSFHSCVCICKNINDIRPPILCPTMVTCAPPLISYAFSTRTFKSAKNLSCSSKKNNLY